MRHPAPSAPLRLTALLCALSLALPAPTAWAADPVPDKAQAANEDLLTHLKAVMTDRITCKPGATLYLKVKNGKKNRVALDALDLTGATYTPVNGEEEKAAWSDMDGPAASLILDRAVDHKNAGESLFAARVLFNLKAGSVLADRYLRIAQATDKQLPAKQSAVLKGAVADLATADFNQTRPKWAWPRLTQAQHAKAIEELNADAKNRSQKAGLRFISDQSEHFIFYTDSDLNTARLWANKLEGAYVRLCKTFDLDPRQNIWQGKCAVILCRDHASYAKWMQVVAPGDAMAAKSAGLSVSGVVFPGSNSIQFFHNPADPAYTESVLIHELAHAFTAQFHGTHYVDSWINEGLADYIASNGSGFPFKAQESHTLIKQRGSMDDFFAARNINFKHYGAACDIATLLIRKNGRGYGLFVKAVTEGVQPDEALKTHCGLTIEQLTAGYGRMLNLPKLRSH